VSNLTKNKPKGFLRWVLRAPIWLYHAGLGWILGERFLMLRYVGHKSGLPRETVIEVVRYDKASGTYYVTSGWGTRSDWFQSICKNPEVKIQAGNRQLKVRAQVLGLEDAVHELFLYAKNHPTAFHEISILLTGKALEGTDEECRQLACSTPVIAFHSQAS